MGPGFGEIHGGQGRGDLALPGLEGWPEELLAKPEMAAGIAACRLTGLGPRVYSLA